MDEQLRFFVFFDVPASAAFSTFTTGSGLLPILLFHFRSLECIGHANGIAVVCTGVLNRSHENVFQGDAGVFNLLTTRFADGQFNFGQVFTACAVFQDCCSGFVDQSVNVQMALLNKSDFG